MKSVVLRVVPTTGTRLFLLPVKEDCSRLHSSAGPVVILPPKASFYIYKSYSFYACLSLKASLCRYIGLGATPPAPSSPQSDCRRLRVRLLDKFAFCGTWNQDSTIGIVRVRTLKLPTPVAGVPELCNVCLTLHVCWTVGKEEDSSELWGCQWQDRRNALCRNTLDTVKEQMASFIPGI